MAVAVEKSFWEKEVEVARIPKNDRDEIRVKLVSKNGSEYVDVRTWYEPRGGGELLPGKGIALPVDIGDEVAQAILEATAQRLD